MGGSHGKEGKALTNCPLPHRLHRRSFLGQTPESKRSFSAWRAAGGNLSACDDLKHSNTNLSCVLETRIKLVSWGHVAVMCRRVAKSDYDWHSTQADRADAYRKIPTAWRNSRLVAVALKCPH